MHMSLETKACSVLGIVCLHLWQTMTKTAQIVSYKFNAWSQDLAPKASLAWFLFMNSMTNKRAILNRPFPSAKGRGIAVILVNTGLTGSRFPDFTGIIWFLWTGVSDRFLRGRTPTFEGLSLLRGEVTGRRKCQKILLSDRIFNESLPKKPKVASGGACGRLVMVKIR